MCTASFEDSHLQARKLSWFRSEKKMGVKAPGSTRQSVPDSEEPEVTGTGEHTAQRREPTRAAQEQLTLDWENG